MIRGGDILEKASHLDTIIFDKTGTLTIGKPVITDVASCSTEFSEDRLLQLAAALEKQSSHPLAQAVVLASQAKGKNPHLNLGLGFQLVYIAGHPARAVTPELYEAPY